LFIHLPKGLQEIMGSYQFNLINLVSHDLPHQFPESQHEKGDPHQGKLLCL